MFENNAKGWYGSYSVIGRNSVQRFALILKKDEIISGNMKKAFYGDYFSTDDQKILEEDNKDKKGNNIDIFSIEYDKLKEEKLKIKEEEKMVKNANLCTHHMLAEKERYKFHQNHHKESERNMHLMRRKDIENFVSYHPKMDFIWKRTVTGPKWKLQKERNLINIENSNFNKNKESKKQQKSKKRTNEKKLNKKERNSVIYTKPNAILTLNGDSDTNKDEFSQQISESSSESDEKTEKMKNIHKKFFEDKNNKKNGNNNSKIVIFKNETKNIEKIKKIKEIKDNGIKKLINSEKNIKKGNKITNSNKIIISNKNTFTTTTNTLHTQNTQDSSFKSLQIDAKKYNYDYLNLSDLSLQKKDRKYI